MIVRKADGGYLYATTDLAGARFRVEQLGAQRVIYVIDARQAQHLAMVFKAARCCALAGWASPGAACAWIMWRSGRCWARTASRSRRAAETW